MKEVVVYHGVHPPSGEVYDVNFDPSKPYASPSLASLLGVLDHHGYTASFFDGNLDFWNCFKDKDLDTESRQSVDEEVIRDHSKRILDLSNSGDLPVVVHGSYYNKGLVSELLRRSGEEGVDLDLIFGGKLENCFIFRTAPYMIAENQPGIMENLVLVWGPMEFGAVEALEDPRPRTVDGVELFNTKTWNSVSPDLRNFEDTAYKENFSRPLISYGCPRSCDFCVVSWEESHNLDGKVRTILRDKDSFSKDIEIWSDWADPFYLLQGEMSMSQPGHLGQFKEGHVLMSAHLLDIAENSSKLDSAGAEFLIAYFGVDNFARRPNEQDLGKRGYDPLEAMEVAARASSRSENTGILSNSGGYVTFTPTISLDELTFHLEKVKLFSDFLRKDYVESSLVVLPGTRSESIFPGQKRVGDLYVHLEPEPYFSDSRVAEVKGRIDAIRSNDELPGFDSCSQFAEFVLEIAEELK